MSLHILVFKITFDDPWKVSVNYTDILKLVFCNQKFPDDQIQYTNSEDCLEIFNLFPTQNYESELIIIFAIAVFVMIMMVILLSNHIKDLFTNWKVFPFISLILTPLMIMHVFTVDVKLAEVTKLLMKRLF